MGDGFADRIITGSLDGTVRVWNRETGKNMWSIVGHTKYLRTVQFDREKLVTDGFNNVVVKHDFSEVVESSELET